MKVTTLPRPLYPVELVVKGRSHHYRVDGKDVLYPGVTGVLQVLNKPALVPWAAKQAALKIKTYLMAHAVNRLLTAEEIDDLVEAGRTAHEEIKDAAADVGTRAHQAINAMIDGGEMTITDDIKPCVDAFLDFIARDSLKIEHGDTKIASKLYGYGGSLDALGNENGRLVIVDFKTSNGIWPEYALQVAAYSQAFKETYGLGYLPEALILRIGKVTPDFEVKRVRCIADCFDQFKAALTLYHGSKAKVYEVA